MNNIVVINGYPQSGKDTFVDLCKKHYGKVESISTIDDVKGIATRMGWDGVKDNKARDFLSEIKAAWIKYNNGIFLSTIRKCKEVLDRKDRTLLFIHCREPEEIKKILDCFPYSAMSLIIVRDVQGLPENASDNNVNNYKYGYTVHNNGTLGELEQEAISFIDTIKICL